jgi:hypothetical protein
MVRCSSVVANNSKMFARVMPEKLPAAYKTLIDALCDKSNAHITSSNCPLTPPQHHDSLQLLTTCVVPM